VPKVISVSGVELISDSMQALVAHMFEFRFSGRWRGLSAPHLLNPGEEIHRDGENDGGIFISTPISVKVVDNEAVR
jgi:hypothetical protein